MSDDSNPVFNSPTDNVALGENGECMQEITELVSGIEQEADAHNDVASRSVQGPASSCP